MTVECTRRNWLAAAGAASMAAGWPGGAMAQAPKAEGTDHKVCAFVKFIQSLSFEEMAARLAQMGYQGIEATVRNKGLVLPENVERDLPRLVKALAKEGLEITVMASDINDPSDPLAQRVLKTAADLGVTRYRMKYYRYSLKQPVRTEIESHRKTVEKLADANRKLGITAVYQNHAGAKYLGATIWDLALLLADVDPQHVGAAFDIRHATATGGESWQVLWNAIEPHVSMVYVKDFHWARKPNSARQVMENVPLGKGQVSPQFFELLKDDSRPISLHVEYLKDAGLDPNVQALADDLKTLRRLLKR